MKVIIRTDSSFQIGTGHVVRCLSLAQRLRELGISVSFLCRVLDGNIISLIEEKQFKVIKLSSPKTPLKSNEVYEQWRGVSLEEEIQECTQIFQSESPNFIVVDHYSLTKKWESHFQKVAKILVIDDLYRQHSCDALLDQNTLSQRIKYQGLTSGSTSLFLGPEYALLSSAFLKIKPCERQIGKVEKCLIFFGGSDHTGETLKLLQSFDSRFAEIKFEIVIGKVNRDAETIKSLCATNSNFNLHIQTDRMADLMQESDLFIGAGGTTTWERCYLGLPSLCLSTAENQVGIAKELHEMQIHEYLGNWDKVSQQKFTETLLMLIQNETKRKQYSQNSLKMNVASLTPNILNFFKESF